VTGARVPLALALVLALAAACTRSPAAQGESTRPPVSSTPSTSPSTSPALSPSPSSLPARFVGTVSRLPADLRAEMHGTTWHRGCPVPLGDLRLLTLRYWGFDGEVHEGPMVVNASVAQDVVGAFRTLFEARFPTADMVLSKKFRPNADPNTKLSETGSFNCRPIVTPAGPGATMSMHSYGLAIDVNTLQNPYVATDGYVRNRYARPYRDRSQDLPGMIHEGDVVVRAFAAIGWEWGGDWSSGQDYMHFSTNGR